MRLHPLPTSYGWPTTRRHPRSLAEAFPAEHAAAIERYRGPVPAQRILGVLLAVVIGCLGAMALVHGLVS
jgi:hypothetical protein